MPPSKGDRSDDIKQLILEFDSDDEPRAEAVQGSSKGSSNAATTRPGPRAQLAAADATRDANVKLRIALLKRIKGGFPVFDDESPDPGCAYEVARCTDLFDPYNRDSDHDELLAVSKECHQECCKVPNSTWKPAAHSTSSSHEKCQSQCLVTSL